MVRTDCVFLRYGSRGYTCTALFKLECESCRFFKTGEQQGKSLKKSEERLKRLNLDSAYRQPPKASAVEIGERRGGIKVHTTDKEKRNMILSVLKEENGLTPDGIRKRMIAIFGKGASLSDIRNILDRMKDEGIVDIVVNPHLKRGGTRIYLGRD